MSRFRSVCIAFVVAVACGGPQQLGAAGATCFRDDDCEAGMICVAPKPTDIHRVCSNDPTPLISMVDGPPVMMTAGAAAIAGAAGMGGGAGMATAGAPNAGASVGGNAAAGAAGKAGSAGAAGTTGGTDAAGTGGSAGTGGTAGTAPEGGAPP